MLLNINKWLLCSTQKDYMYINFAHPTSIFYVLVGSHTPFLFCLCYMSYNVVFEVITNCDGKNFLSMCASVCGEEFNESSVWSTLICGGNCPLTFKIGISGSTNLFTFSSFDHHKTTFAGRESLQPGFVLQESYEICWRTNDPSGVHCFISCMFLPSLSWSKNNQLLSKEIYSSWSYYKKIVMWWFSIGTCGH